MAGLGATEGPITMFKVPKVPAGALHERLTPISVSYAPGAGPAEQKRSYKVPYAAWTFLVVLIGGAAIVASLRRKQ